MEIAATVLLALAAVATAWSGYQASRWNGEQAKAVGRANAARIESARASDSPTRRREVDVATFTQWANAYALGETTLADFYFRRFRAEFEPAVNAWIATRPLKNPGRHSRRSRCPSTARRARGGRSAGGGRRTYTRRRGERTCSARRTTSSASSCSPRPVLRRDEHEAAVCAPAQADPALRPRGPPRDRRVDRRPRRSASRSDLPVHADDRASGAARDGLLGRPCVNSSEMSASSATASIAFFSASSCASA